MPSTKGKPVMPKITTNRNLIDRITDKENIYDAYKQTLVGDSKYKIDAMLFSIDETYNLMKLRQSLLDKTYAFDNYEEFYVMEPKERLIHAPSYKDKIVQLAINNVLKEIYNPSFIYDSYACIDNKGTHKCVDRISYFMRKAKWQYGEDAYIIKMDIEKFFYTIDREILKEMIRKKIDCEETLNLIFKIVDSADMIDYRGLPLGNTLSQLFANVYMNEMDQYAKRKLGLKFYVRYADDTIIIVKDKETANEVLDGLIEFYKKVLNLTMSLDKTKIFPIAQGVNAIGFKIHTTHRLLRNDSKKKIKRKSKRFPDSIAEGRMTIEKAEQILNSWLGHAEHGNSYNFIQSLLARNDYLYLNHKGVFKIDATKIGRSNKDGVLQGQSMEFA